MTVRKGGSKAPPIKPKPPSRVDVRWLGGSRYEGGRPERPHITLDTSGVTGPGPVETLMLALATCTSEDVLSILEKRRTPVKSLRIEAEGIRKVAVPARVIAITLTYHIDGDDVDAAHAMRAIKLAVEKYCSVRCTLDPDLPITLKLVLNGKAHS